MSNENNRHLPIAGATPIAGTVPNLDDYDCILVSSSGGKDSQAQLDYIVALAREQSDRHAPHLSALVKRIVVVHADLGRVEWAGTRELAEKQAAHYGVRFIVCSRIGGVAKRSGKVYQAGEVYGDLLDYAERRGKMPDAQNRWCTSDFKRGPIRKVITQLHREHGSRRQFRVLQCLGLRAEESPGRAKKPQLAKEPGASTKRRTTMTWLPIQHWTEQQVWDCIRRSGAPYHRAYDLGMPRLSCVFCIFAPRAALMIAGEHNRALLDDYIGVEERTGFTFKNGFALSEIRDALDAGETATSDALNGAWNM